MASKGPAALSLIVIASAVVLLALPLSRPDIEDASAAATAFSAERALLHVRAIGRQPRVTGSPEIATARDYLVRQLRESGVETDVQRTAAAHRVGNRLQAASVENVVGRLRGLGGGKALLLTAHYDSVPTGAGASDDAAGVAALLETVRALGAGPRPKNDVIFLFTDAEEPCLCGARAFVTSYPWADDVGLVLNFEARGNRGPVMMFETAGDNLWMARRLGDAARGILASSVASFFYRLGGSDTDLSVFRSAGLRGMNFAFLTGITHYHTAIDTVDQLDVRSLQHLGEYALPLARRLGNADLTDVPDGDAVYFTILGRLISYPESWRFPLSILVVGTFGGVLITARHRRRLRWSGVAWGLLLVPVATLIATGVVMGLWRMLLLIHPARDPIVFEYRAWMFWVATTSLTLAVTLPILRLLQRKVEPADLALGSLVWWVLLAVATALMLPAASYLFAWPAVFALGAVAIGYGLFVSLGPRLRTGLAATCAVPALAVYAPAIYGLTVALGLFLLVALPGVVVLLVTLLIPLASDPVERLGRLLPVGALVVGVGLLAAGGAMSRFDAERPRVTGVSYVLNADTDEAVWASSDGSPNEWTSRFLGPDPQSSSLENLGPQSGTEELLHRRAPAVDMAGPQISLVGDSGSEGKRQVAVGISTPPGAPRLAIEVTGNAEITGLAAGGTPVPLGVLTESGRARVLEYAAPPPEGLTVTLTASDGDPVALIARTGFAGLPAGSPRRPPDTMPGQHEHFIDDWSYVVSTFRLPPPR